MARDETDQPVQFGGNFGQILPHIFLGSALKQSFLMAA